MSKELIVYTTKEVADILKVTERTVKNWIKDDKIKSFKVGKGRRITQQALEDFIEKGTN